MSNTKCFIFFAGMWMVMCGVFLPHAASSQTTTGQRYAVVIGVDRYAGRVTDFQDLHYAEKDANAIVDALRGKQYVVTPLINEKATKSEILATLAYLAANTKKQDTVLIYFAGHGVKRTFGETEYSYWVPYVNQMSPAWDDVGIRVLHLLQYIADIKASKKILLLDHCHSGFAPGSNLTRNSSRNFGAAPFSEQEFQDEVDTVDAEGFTILGAAQENAYELDDLEHGVFTHVLLQALNSTDADDDNDGALDVGELRKYMKTRIPQVIQELKNAGSLPSSFEQTPFSHTTGESVDWKLLDVRVDLDSLVIFFGELAVRGELQTAIRARVLIAIQNVTEASAENIPPNSTDAKIVSELVKIRDMGSQFSWRLKAQMLVGAIGGAS